MSQAQSLKFIYYSQNLISLEWTRKHNINKRKQGADRKERKKESQVADDSAFSLKWKTFQPEWVRMAPMCYNLVVSFFPTIPYYKHIRYCKFNRSTENRSEHCIVFLCNCAYSSSSSHWSVIPWFIFYTYPLLLYTLEIVTAKAPKHPVKRLSLKRKTLECLSSKKAALIPSIKCGRAVFAKTVMRYLRCITCRYCIKNQNKKKIREILAIEE